MKVPAPTKMWLIVLGVGLIIIPILFASGLIYLLL